MSIRNTTAFQLRRIRRLFIVFLGRLGVFRLIYKILNILVKEVD